MPHDGQMDGQDMNPSAPLLPDLLALTRDALTPLDQLLEIATARVRATVSDGDRVSGALVEQNQYAAHGLAWLATYVYALRQMHRWAETLSGAGKLGEMEQLIHQIAFGEYLWQIYGGIQMNQGEVLRLQDLGLSQDDQRALMAPSGDDVDAVRQHPGGAGAAGGADGAAVRQHHVRHLRSRRGTGDDPRPVPPLRAGKGRALCA